MHRRLLPLAVICAAALALPAATAAGRPLAQAAGAHSVRLATLPGQFAFNSKRLSAGAGTVTIRMHNNPAAGFAHGIALSGKGVRRIGPIVDPGGTAKLTVKLAAGTYTFFCPVKGHRALGMRGTLTVR